MADDDSSRAGDRARKNYSFVFDEIIPEEEKELRQTLKKVKGEGVEAEDPGKAQEAADPGGSPQIREAAVGDDEEGHRHGEDKVRKEVFLEEVELKREAAPAGQVQRAEEEGQA